MPTGCDHRTRALALEPSPRGPPPGPGNEDSDDRAAPARHTCPSPTCRRPGSPPTTPRIRTRRSRRSSRCGRRRARRTCSSCCSTTSASVPSSAFGGPCHTPDAERLAAGGLKYNRFHTTALCAPDAPGPADRAATTTRWAWASITETATSAPGQQLAATQHQGPARRDAEAQRLLHRPVRQVPRGAGVAVVAHGPVRRVAARAAASSTSTGSSAARTTSGTRRSTRAPRRSSRRPRRRRATTSPRTWPTTPSTGCASRRR